MLVPRAAPAAREDGLTSAHPGYPPNPGSGAIESHGDEIASPGSDRLRRPPQVSRLGRGELLDRVRSRPSLHFDDDQQDSEAHQQIDLVGTDTEVASADGGAAPLEEPDRQVFAVRS